MAMLTQAYLLTGPDIEVAARLAARAVDEDPAFSYLVQDPAIRPESAFRAYRMLFRLSHHGGGTWGLGEPLEAVAAWFRPGTPPPDPLAMLDAGLMDVAEVMGKPLLARLGSFNHALLDLHQRVIPLPHWYLAHLGVEPGPGAVLAARTLLHPVLETADRDGVPCYAEAASPRVLDILLGLGFQPEARLTLDDVVQVLGLVRPAPSA